MPNGGWDFLLSKEEILALYLNRAPMGGNIRGVEAAARIYFNKRAKDLSAGEASLPRLQVDLPAIARSSAPVDRSIRVAAPAAPWLLISGSGSTGRSKLIPSTHAQGNTLMRIEISQGCIA